MCMLAVHEPWPVETPAKPPVEEEVEVTVATPEVCPVRIPIPRIAAELVEVPADAVTK